MKMAFTIGWKLLLAFGVVAGLSATSAIVGWVSFDETQKVQTSITQETVPTLNKARTVAQTSRLLVATTPNLVDVQSHALRENEAVKLLGLAKNLTAQLSDLTVAHDSLDVISELKTSTQSITHNLHALNSLVEQRIDTALQFQSETDTVLSDIDGFVNASEALVTNASASTSTRITDLSRMIDGANSDEDLQTTLDELIEIDIDHMELMFEMRHRVAILGLLVEQNAKAKSVKEIKRLEDNYTDNLKVVKRRSREVRDPNRKTQLEQYLTNLTPHEASSHDITLFGLRQHILTLETSIDSLLKTNAVLMSDMQRGVDQIVSLAEQDMGAALRDSEKKMQASNILMLAIAVFSLAGAIPIMWFYVRNRVVKRVNKLSENTHTIVQGDLDINIDTSGDDELSEMADALEVFRQNAIEKLKTDAELRDHKEHLETIVEKRTDQLTQANDRLSKEAEQHAQARSEAEQANRVKSAFLASMSHEIRTPITSILGTLHLFDESKIQPTTKHRLDIIRASGETLLSIINDILDYSKIEADCIEIDNVAFGLFDLVNDLQLILAPIAERKDITLLIIPNMESGACYKGDPGHIRQVLINVLGNAVKFTQSGKVIFTFSQNEQGVIFEIEDTGPGIPSEEQEHLFDDFFQSSQTRHLKSGGTGLGLTICKRLINEMGGDISVHSEIGHGSLFTIFIPLEQLVGEEAEACRQNHEIEPASQQTLEILLVEDNAINQEITLSFLQKEGHQVDAVFTGLDAVRQATANSYDLILMDVSLPDIDGLEATRLIRKHENTSDVPIIAISAHVFKEEVDQYLQSGMNGFLAKPFSPSQLSKAINSVMGGEITEMENRNMSETDVFDANIMQEDLPVLGIERVHKLIDTFLDKIDQDLASVIEARDTKTLAEQAHSMKSAAGSLGLTALFQQAKALEMAAKSNDETQCQNLLTDLADTINQAKDALIDFKASLN